MTENNGAAIKNERLLALFLAVTGFAFFSATDIAGKILIEKYNAFHLTFWYGVILMFTLMVLAPFLGGWKATIQTKKLKWHIARAALTGFIPILNIYALSEMQLVNFYTIVFVSPFLTALIAIPFINEHVPLRRWLIILGGFAGVAIGMRPDIYGLSWAAVAVMITALSFSLRSLIVPKMGNQETLLSLGFYPTLGIILCGLVGTTDNLMPPAALDFMLLGFASVLGAAGLIMNSAAFRMAPASAVAPTHYTQMIWGLIFGYLLFADIPDFWMIVGASIVCGCGVALIFTERQKPAQHD